MSKVSLVSHTDSYQGTLKVLEPLKENLKAQLKDLEKIVIKINFVTMRYELATTPVDSVRAFVDFVEPFFNGEIIIAEEASIGNTKQGFEDHGFAQLAKEKKQVSLFDSAEDEVEDVKIIYPKGDMVLPLAKIYTQSPFIVSMCRAKTHDTVVVTLSLKNLLVGAIQGGLGARGKIHQGMSINWILKEIAKYTYPNLSIIDGTIGMEGDGPTNGTPIEADWLLASTDPLAADSIATHLMGFDINDVGYLNLIHELGTGKLYPVDKERIEIIGSEPNSLVINFKPHDSFERQRLWNK